VTMYKVLNEDGSCCYGGQGRWPLPTKRLDGTWTPGAWLEVEGKLKSCANGLHACRDEQVLDYLGSAMFELEYEGEVQDTGDKCVGRKARLLRRFEGWNPRSQRLFASDCAERMLPLYEAAYPNDTRPRVAIDTARRYANGEATLQELAAASDAAWDAASAAARAAAWDAAWDAARDAAWDAARAAARAAAWDAARAAARAAAWDAAWGAAWRAERAWQYQQLCEYLGGAL